MPKKRLSASQVAAIRQEAEAVAEMVKTPGWQVIEADLLRQAETIQTLLVENRLRTVEETIVQGATTKSFLTTAETQIAENAGMYKQIRQIFSTIEAILTAPDELVKAEREGRLVVEKPDAHTPPPPPPPARASLLDATVARIKGLLQRVPRPARSPKTAHESPRAAKG